MQDQDLKAKEFTDDPNEDLHVDPDAPGDFFTPALEGRPWRIAKSLLRLKEQLKIYAPRRSTASDGAIGNAEHQSRASDHNPWVTSGNMGVVTAIDITHDPAGGCDAGRLADAIRSSRDERVKYIIWNRQICNSAALGSAQPWQWRAYTGKNPHDHHVHISVKADAGAYDGNSDWSLPG